MPDYEFGSGIWMFQQFVDRYATDAYGPPVGTLEAIERAAEVGDIKVLDINYPFAGEEVTVDQVRAALQRFLDRAGLRHDVDRHARERLVLRQSQRADEPADRGNARQQESSSHSVPPTMPVPVVAGGPLDRPGRCCCGRVLRRPLAGRM